MIKGRFKKKSFKELLPLLKGFRFSSVEVKDGSSGKDWSVGFEIIESRDSDGNKAVWYSARLGPEGVEFSYSDGSARRGLEAAEVVLSLLLTLDGYYDFDWVSLAESLLPLLRNCNEVLSTELKRKSTMAEVIKAKEELEEKHKELLSMNEKNIRLTEELQKQNDRLKARIAELEALGTEELKALIMKWISSSEGEFSVEEFSEKYSIAPARVKEVLNLLIKERYIKRID